MEKWISWAVTCLITSTAPVQHRLSRDLQGNLKASKTYNRSVGYHPGLTAYLILEKENITREVASE